MGSKKEISIIAKDCFDFRATLVDINLGAENATRVYSSNPTDGSKFERVGGGLPTYDPEPMRYFGSLATGLLSAQIIHFLPRASEAKKIQTDHWPKIFELSGDDP